MFGLQSAELFGSMVPSEMAKMADFAIESLMQSNYFRILWRMCISLKDDTVASVDDECL